MSLADVYSLSASNDPDTFSGMGVVDNEPRKQMLQGPLKATGRALDLAISGLGFFDAFCHALTTVPTSIVASTKSTMKLFLAVAVHFQSQPVTNATASLTLSTWTTMSPKNATLISATTSHVRRACASRQIRLITATVIPGGLIDSEILG